MSAVEVLSTGLGADARITISAPHGLIYPSPVGVSFDLTIAEARSLRDGLVAEIERITGVKWFR